MKLNITKSLLGASLLWLAIGCTPKEEALQVYVKPTIPLDEPITIELSAGGSSSDVALRSFGNDYTDAQKAAATNNVSTEAEDAIFSLFIPELNKSDYEVVLNTGTFTVYHSRLGYGDYVPGANKAKVTLHALPESGELTILTNHVETAYNATIDATATDKPLLASHHYYDLWSDQVICTSNANTIFSYKSKSSVSNTSAITSLLTGSYNEKTLLADSAVFTPAFKGGTVTAMRGLPMSVRLYKVKAQGHHLNFSYTSDGTATTHEKILLERAVAKVVINYRYEDDLKNTQTNIKALFAENRLLLADRFVSYLPQTGVDREIYNTIYQPLAIDQYESITPSHVSAGANSDNDTFEPSLFRACYDDAELTDKKVLTSIYYIPENHSELVPTSSNHLPMLVVAAGKPSLRKTSYTKETGFLDTDFVYPGQTNDPTATNPNPTPVPTKNMETKKVYFTLYEKIPKTPSNPTDFYRGIRRNVVYTYTVYLTADGNTQISYTVQPWTTKVVDLPVFE